MPDIKKSVFAFIAIFIVPLLVFVLLESGLRIFGVGTSFDYFHEINIDGRAHFQENPDFADQFYPPALNIGPLENTFAKEPDSDLIRVYVLGGSAAMGFPFRNHGLDRLLATQLRAALPSRTVEVINTAMTSVNSHVVYEVARSIPEKSAYFAIILMGNNEVVGPYGPGTLNQNFLSNISLIRGFQALRRSRTWQALDGLVAQIKPENAQQDLKWEGMQMFTSHGVSRNDPRMQSVYSHYEDNLVDTIEILRDKGIHVVLSSVPANLRHSAPFLSVHREGMSDEQMNLWRDWHDKGSRSFEIENWHNAISCFQEALETDPGYAETHFMLATAFENVGDFQNAKAHYIHALDLDALRFRADSEINSIIRKVADAAGDDAFSFVDSAAAFEQASLPFQAGWNLLLEHVHYDFRGNHVLAAEMSRSIVSELIAPGNYEPLLGEEVAKRIGFPNHETIDNIKDLQRLVQHPPFPGQTNYTDLEGFLDDKLASVTVEVGSPRDVVRRRRDIVSSGLADWKVHFELAALARNSRNRQGTYYHLNQLFKLYPHNRESYMNVAELLSQDENWNEAISYLERSLFYTRGDEIKIAETVGWLGTAYLRTGDYDTATDLLLEVTSEYPDQIYLTLKAFGNLIRYSKETGKLDDLDRYVSNAQRYAKKLVRSGDDEKYPPLYTRMSQLMTMAGYADEAQEWADAQEH
ncbi:MAG: tetratricopeptide repeat protein [Gammaproteobacteria bacterium]|nr:tetratricopeptide repeat protein [Gammaproteobacteria bacterium]